MRVLDEAKREHGNVSILCWCGGVCIGGVVAPQYKGLERVFFAAPAFFLRQSIDAS